MKPSNRTGILIALLLLVILVQVFPGRSNLIKVMWVIAVALYYAIWTVRRLVLRHQQRSAEAAQAAADAAEYRRYEADAAALRERFGAPLEGADSTSNPQAYRDALTALHAQHRDMLERKFGPRS